MQSSLFLVPNKEILKDTMSLNAEYLFQNDKFYNAEYDLGDKTIQVGSHIAGDPNNDPNFSSKSSAAERWTQSKSGLCWPTVVKPNWSDWWTNCSK